MKKRTPDVYFACGCLWKTEADAKQAVTLLKVERARVRRMVKKMADQSQSFDVQEFTVKLLAKLKKGI